MPGAGLGNTSSFFYRSGICGVNCMYPVRKLDTYWYLPIHTASQWQYHHPANSPHLLLIPSPSYPAVISPYPAVHFILSCCTPHLILQGASHYPAIDVILSCYPPPLIMQSTYLTSPYPATASRYPAGHRTLSYYITCLIPLSTSHYHDIYLTFTCYQPHLLLASTLCYPAIRFS
jgi:hypothetical protein